MYVDGNVKRKSNGQKGLENANICLHTKIQYPLPLKRKLLTWNKKHTPNYRMAQKREWIAYSDQ